MSHDTNFNHNHQTLQKQLQNYLQREDLRLKQALDGILPFYQKMHQSPQAYLHQLFLFKLNHFYHAADLWLKLTPINHKKNVFHLNVQIHSPINHSIDDFSLASAQVKYLTLLAKINHEYIKILTPQQIHDVDLIKLSCKNEPLMWVIEQQIDISFSKNTLEKWLWLIDYFLSSLQK